MPFSHCANALAAGDNARCGAISQYASSTHCPSNGRTKAPLCNSCWLITALDSATPLPLRARFNTCSALAYETSLTVLPLTPMARNQVFHHEPSSSCNNDVANNSFACMKRPCFFNHDAEHTGNTGGRHSNSRWPEKSLRSPYTMPISASAGSILLKLALASSAIRIRGAQARRYRGAINRSENVSRNHSRHPDKRWRVANQCGICT